MATDGICVAKGTKCLLYIVQTSRPEANSRELRLGIFCAKTMLGPNIKRCAV